MALVREVCPWRIKFEDRATIVDEEGKEHFIHEDFDMLPKEYRLKKRTAFSATYKTGLSFHKDGITLFCGKVKKDNYPTKVGFVVSKKIHKRAVKRNRIKRLLRESLRLYIKRMNNTLDTKYMSLIFNHLHL